MFQTGQAPTRRSGLECGSSSYRLHALGSYGKMGKAKVRKAVVAATGGPRCSRQYLSACEEKPTEPIDRICPGPGGADL